MTNANKQNNEVDFPEDLNKQREHCHGKQPVSDRMKDTDAEFERHDRVQGTGSSSPVIPLHPRVCQAFEHRTRPALFPEIEVDPKEKDRATKIAERVQPNGTLLARFGKSKDEHEANAKHQTGVVAAPDRRVDSAGGSDAEDYDFVPGTPPSKKFKAMFFGVSQQPSQSAETARGSSAVVLCEDTDEEDSD